MFTLYFNLLIPRFDQICWSLCKYVYVQYFKKLGSVEVGQNCIPKTCDSIKLRFTIEFILIYYLKMMSISILNDLFPIYICIYYMDTVQDAKNN